MKLGWKITIGAVVALFVVAMIIWRVGAANGPEVKTAPVEKRSVTQEVVFTGRLKAKATAKLAFETTGTVDAISVEVGDRVTAGQQLARLDSRGVSLELAKARADQAAATDQAKLAWQNAVATGTKTEQESSKTLALRRQAVRDAKTEMDQALDVWQQTVRESGDESSTTKTKYSLFLSAQSVYRTAQQTLTQSEATTAKTNQAAVAQADEAYDSYLSTQQASATTNGLSSGQATQALANLRLVKSIAIAPFDGVVIAKSVNAGEVAPAAAPVITVETTDSLQVVADVPESDITKLQNGMEATFTLDAFTDNRTLTARIISIAPSATLLEGVPTYEVKMEIAGETAALKSGMTANVTVQSAHKENVVAIPRRAVVRTGGQYKVRVISADGSQREVDVTLGVLGSDGYVEITQGLTGGETIVTGESS